MTGVVSGRSAAVDREPADRLAQGVFWMALVLASALPQIVLTELTGEAPWTLALGQLLALLALLALVRPSPRLQVLDVPLRWLVAMAAG